MKRWMFIFCLLVSTMMMAGCKTEPSSVPVHQDTSLTTAAQVSSSQAEAEDTMSETPNKEPNFASEEFIISEIGISLTLKEPFFQIVTSDLVNEQQVMQILAYIDGMERLDEPNSPGSMSGVTATVRYRGDAYSYFFDSRGLGRKMSDTDVTIWYSIDPGAYDYLKNIVINMVYDHLQQSVSEQYQYLRKNLSEKDYSHMKRVDNTITIWCTNEEAVRRVVNAYSGSENADIIYKSTKYSASALRPVLDELMALNFLKDKEIVMDISISENGICITVFNLAQAEEIQKWLDNYEKKTYVYVKEFSIIPPTNPS